MFTKSVIEWVAVSISGQSNVDIWAASPPQMDRRFNQFNRIQQRGANVRSHDGTSAPPGEYDWTVHPSAHWSPQSKRQMDRFSRFCTANGRKCLYFTMGAPIHQNCPFPRGIWTSHVTCDAFGPCEPTTQMAPRSVQPSLYRWPRSASIVVQWFASFPLKIAPSYVIRGSSGPPESGTQMVTWSFQPFSAGLSSVTHWQSDRKTDRQTTLLVPCGGVIMRNFMGYGKAKQSQTISPLLSRHLYVQNI